MHFEYHKGCKITLHSGEGAELLLARVRKRVEAQYAGAEVVIEAKAPKGKVEAGGVLVPHGHALNSAGEVNPQGQVVRPMGGELILRHVMEIIREEQAT